MLSLCLLRLPFGRPSKPLLGIFSGAQLRLGIKLGKTNGCKFIKLNFISNWEMIIRYEAWNGGSCSPLLLLLFLSRFLFP